MAIKFNRSQTFATNGTVDAPSLHNLVDGLDIYQSLITDQTNVTSVSTADELLIAIAAGSSGDAPKAVTVQELFQDALTAGTYTNANISAALTYGTATGTRLVSDNATITTGTITTAVIPTLTSSTATFGTTTSTAATITSGTITNLASTTGTIATLNSTTGTIATLVTSAGTFAGSLVNVTTGTIGNFTTTLTGDLTISQGTATLSTTGATAGTYGTTGVIPRIAVDSNGRITSIGTALGGKILQVVESTYSTSVVVASTSFSDTGLSSSITPTYSSSRILVLAQQNTFCSRVSATIGAKLKIVRTIGATPTDIYSQGASALDILITSGGATSTGLLADVFVECVDSPNTTSQCTYKLQGAATTIANSGQVEFQNGSSISKLILMEVAA